MKVCLICVEIFAWGKYGGFGRSTRMLGRELTQRGIEVCAVVPRRPRQQPVEELDGFTVYSFPPEAPWQSKRLYAQCDADIYHSQEPSMGTYFAIKTMPHKRHIITFRDPRDMRDWGIELARPSRSRLQTFLSMCYENNLLVRQAVRRADRRFCCATYLGPKCRRVYHLKDTPALLPSPIRVPARPMQKSERPTVCFLARWDRRKRPELFFELARQRPQVQFIAVGKAQDRAYDRQLRQRYSNLPNLQLAGFIDQFASDGMEDLLEKSWILANTASREGLPTSFLEALAHGCALLSAVNPDGVTERFGRHVQADDDFALGLDRLLQNDAWRAKGEQGKRFVEAYYEMHHTIDQHVKIYREALHT